MNKNLIVFFSHNKENYVSGTIKDLKVGNTKIVAEKLKHLIDADVFEIKPLHEYPYDYNECTKRAKTEQVMDERPKINNILNHIEEYDNIYLGYPNWWSTMPMIVWTFLESYDLSGKHIYPICTHEGSEMGTSEKDLKKLCPNSVIHKGLAIKGSTVQNCDERLKQWLKDGGK